METAQILNDFENYLKLKSIRSYERYLIYVSDFLKYLKAQELDYLRIKTLEVENYRAYLLTIPQGNARATINNRLTRLKQFYRFLLLKKYIATSPFDAYFKGLKRGMLLPKNILSVEDTGRLLDGFSIKTDRDLMVKSMIELLYGSALRVSELAPLKMSDLDFERGYIIITNVKEGGVKEKRPATEVSLREVRRYVKYAREKLLSAPDREAGYLYPQRSEVANKGLINHKLQTECRRLGLKEISSHAFRHSAATQMLRNGAGIRELQAFLRHKRITNTEVYTHIVKDDLKVVVGKFHPREQD
jgi:integrase/recombinase XerD